MLHFRFSFLQCVAVVFFASSNVACFADIALGLGATQADAGHAITIDDSDNIYVTGKIRQSVDFDPGPGVVSIEAGGSNVFFVASYTPLGALRYVVPIRGLSSTLPETGLDVDGSGNVYVTGSFSGIVDFDPGVDEQLRNSTNGQLFVASYDGNGAYRFAFNIGSGPPFFERGKSIAVSSVGDIWLTGEYSGMTDFDPNEGEFMLEAEGVNDIFLAGYTTLGTFRFAVGMGGTGRDQGNDLAIDASGNSYITGSFRDTVDFDPGAGEFALTSDGVNEDVFVASYSDGGGFRYALRAGGTPTDIGRGIDVDGAGNVFVTGGFSGVADFDPGPGTVEVTSASVNDDVFVASYSSTGALRFAFGLGNVNSDVGYAVAVDADGSFYVTGGFRNGFDFDPGPDEFLVNTVAVDTFVARYDNDGGFIFAHAILPPPSAAATGNDIALAVNGTPAIIGTFQGTIDLDLGAGVANTTTNGADDVFFTTLTTDVDTDGDGVADNNDNCTLLANADQRNTNGDAFGNVCDPDLNDDGVVNFVDLGILRGVFFSSDADADFDGDGAVNFLDLGVMRTFFFVPPGPSGLSPPARR
jgi:hypothetical protein